MLRGTLQIPKKALDYFRDQCVAQDKYPSGTYNPVIEIPNALAMFDVEGSWPIAITQGMINFQGKDIRYKEIAYSDYSIRKHNSGEAVLQVCISEEPINGDTVGYGIPISWLVNRYTTEDSVAKI